MNTSRLQKNISLGLLFSFLFSLSVPALAAKSDADKETARVAKIKASVAKLGTGPDAKIKIKLNDKTKLSGYVSQVNADTFVVADAKTGATTEVAYPNVAQAKGKNLSTGAIIAISSGIAVGATLLTLFILAYALGGD